jgi:hypothetical protein
LLQYRYPGIISEKRRKSCGGNEREGGRGKEKNAKKDKKRAKQKKRRNMRIMIY